MPTWDYEKVRIINAIKENHTYDDNVSLEDNVRGIAIDLDDALKREAQKVIEIAKLRDLLNEAHAARDNALDEARGLREALIAVQPVIENAEHVLNVYHCELNPGETYPVETYGEIGPDRFAGRVCSDLYAQLFAIRRALSGRFD